MTTTRAANAEVLRWLEAMPLCDNPGGRPAPVGAAPSWEQWLADARVVAGLASALAALLRGDPDALRRSSAALALGFLGDAVGGEAGHAALLAALADDVPLVAMEAAGALGRWGRGADAAALCRALASADANVRASACTALAHLGGAGALAALQGAAGDADPFVRAAAGEALRYLAGATGEDAASADRAS